VTELLGSISLATDPGAGQPLAHVVRSDGLATAIAAELGFPVVKIEVVHRVGCCGFLGCAVDASDTARLAGALAWRSSR
jgi:hypothetical protein